MNKWQTYLTLALSLLPTVVETAEKLVTSPNSGAEKKALAVSSLGALTGTSDPALAADPQTQAFNALVSKAVDTQVTVFNTNGTFKHLPVPAGTTVD